MNDLLNGCFLKLISQGRISRLGKLQNINGKRIFRFSVAYNLNRHVEYINYVAYDKHADYMQKYALIGTLIYIESLPYTNRFKVKNSEKFKSQTLNRVENISFIAWAQPSNERDYKEFQDDLAIEILEAKGYIVSKNDNETKKE